MFEALDDEAFSKGFIIMMNGFKQTKLKKLCLKCTASNLLRYVH
jgi:hypothetical protein